LDGTFENTPKAVETYQRLINIVQTQSDSNNINQIVNEPLSQYMTFEISRNADYSNQCRFYQDANSHINHQYYHHPSQSRNLQTEEGLENMHSQQRHTRQQATSNISSNNNDSNNGSNRHIKPEKKEQALYNTSAHTPSQHQLLLTLPPSLRYFV
jgi:hypothetical protein